MAQEIDKKRIKKSWNIAATIYKSWILFRGVAAA